MDLVRAPMDGASAKHTINHTLAQFIKLPFPTRLSRYGTLDRLSSVELNLLALARQPYSIVAPMALQPLACAQEVTNVP